MNNKNKHLHQEPARKNQRTTFDRVVALVDRHPLLLLCSALAAGLILAFFLFDVKLGMGGDDTSYILQAQELATKGVLPIGFKSPGYPVILAFFVSLMGMNVVLLKLTSVVFFLGSLASFFYIFRKFLDLFLFISTFFLFALNLVVLEYSHQTYSEMVFLFIQLWTIYFLWKDQISFPANSLKNIFLIALMSMLGFFVRAIGGTLPLTIALWLLIQKRWRTSIWFIAFCILLYAPLKIIEYFHGTVVMGQASGIFLVNPYNPGMGQETIGGFFERMLNNLFVHLNYMFPKVLSLPYGEHLAGADGRLMPDGMAFIGILISLIIFFGGFSVLRRKNILTFLFLYLSVYLASIFFSLQNLYATPRMLVPLAPVIILFFLLGIQSLLTRILGTQKNQTPTFKKWFVILVVIVFISNIVQIESKVSENFPVLKANLRGDEFVGYSPDWVNYLQASRWIAKNLPKDSVGVICRKPELFQIYTGGFRAYGVYSIEATHPDSIIKHWKQWKMTHLLFDNFQWTSTLRRYVQPAAEQYPAMFELVHQEGSQFPCYIFRLNYAATTDSAMMQLGSRK